MTKFSRQVAFWISAALLLVFTYRYTNFLLFLASEPYKTAATYWASGDAANRHLDPYANLPLTWHFAPTPNDNRTLVDLNLNPPLLLPLFQVLATMRPATMTRMYMAGMYALFACGVWMLLRRFPDMQKRQIVWMFFASPLYDTLTCAQLYPLMFMVSVLAFLALDRQKRTAALWIGLQVAMKPIYVFWPAMLWLSGARKLAKESAAVATAFSAAPLLMYGPRVYAQWIAALGNDPHWIYPSDLSIPAIFTRAGLPHAGLLAGVAFAAAAGWLVARSKPDPLRASVVGMGVTMLASPLAWAEYFMFLYPALVAKRWNRVTGTAAVMIAFPVLFLVLLMRVHPWVSRAMGALGTVAVVLLLLPGSGLGLPEGALRRKMAQREAGRETVREAAA